MNEIGQGPYNAYINGTNAPYPVEDNVESTEPARSEVRGTPAVLPRYRVGG